MSNLEKLNQKNIGLAGSTHDGFFYAKKFNHSLMCYDHESVFNSSLIGKWLNIDLINGRSLSGVLSRYDQDRYLILDDRYIVNPSAIASVDVDFDHLSFSLLKSR